MTVLIVDDHPSFRASARTLLEAEAYEIVGEAENGAAALKRPRPAFSGALFVLWLTRGERAFAARR
jgi:DNA-binding NarL/FixJ family response regulator